MMYGNAVTNSLESLPGTIRPRCGKLAKAVTRVDKTMRQGLCRPWIELLEVGADGAKIGQRRVRPDNLVQLDSGFGQGNSFGVPQDFSHSATLSWVTN
jgi:hypothetical protein